MKNRLVVALSAAVLASACVMSSAFAQEQPAAAPSVSQGATVVNDGGNTVPAPSAKTSRFLKWVRSHQQKTTPGTCVGPASFCDIYFG